MDYDRFRRPPDFGTTGFGDAGFGDAEPDWVIALERPAIEPHMLAKAHTVNGELESVTLI